ncbi:hypothetical protein [Ruegeria sp. HKCCA4812]|uniref:hypothetical protein n=1 Tax=Ruegeria sp. HKCCA4812 TaxID=2682993 RepID=UPI00148914D7|nr:hypothetical protein [Ruegeria sp. HKCCA4812]
MNALPSETTATNKVNKVLECAVEQGVELNRLRSAIDNAEAASASASQARDAAVGAVGEIATTAKQLEDVTQLLEQLHNPWIQDERTFKRIMLALEQERQGGLALIDREVGQFEFAIFRNGGFRELTFSEWNGGIRAMTDSYIRGDVSEFSDSAQFFSLGGSLWVLGTDDVNDNCSGEELRHYYYQYQQTGVHIRNSNGCSVESSPIYKRKRVFQ